MSRTKRPREDGYSWISPLCKCGVTERDHAKATECPGFIHSGEWFNDETLQTLISKEDETTFPRRIKMLEAQTKNLAERIIALERMEKELDGRTQGLIKVGGLLRA